MHRQTVDTLMPLLSVIQQPAFCIRSNGTLAYNNAAKYLIPSCAADLPRWLGDGKLHYDIWDRSGALHLQVSPNGAHHNVTIQALQDGTLFLMSEASSTESAKAAMAVTSQVLRQPLSDLCSSFYLLSQETPEFQSPSVHRNLHRITRIIANLTDLSRLDEQPQLQLSALKLSALMTPFVQELDALCKLLGRDFIYIPSKKDVMLQIDPLLIKRALLNLVSNALKFGAPHTPVTLRTDSIGTHLIFQLENHCSDDGNELLRAAFDRLSQRDLLPDARWGIGLGLPLVSTIARLHGGMVAVETSNKKATVSLSISMRDNADDSKLNTKIALDYTGGMRQTLLELSDILPSEAFL